MHITNFNPDDVSFNVVNSLLAAVQAMRYPNVIAMITAMWRNKALSGRWTFLHCPFRKIIDILMKKGEQKFRFFGESFYFIFIYENYANVVNIIICM